MAISKPLSELVEKLVRYGYRNQDEFLDDWNRIFVEHEKLFKEQIMKANEDGFQECMCADFQSEFMTAEQYYNQTYGAK